MKRNFVIFILYVLFWGFLFGATRVFISGFHWVDDHEIYTVHDDILQHGYVNTFIQWIKNDFNGRFRPLFYWLKVTQIYLFAGKSLYYYIYNMILAILTTFLFYLFAVKIRFNQLLAFIFPLFILLGSQAKIWCALGEYENHGVFFLGIALLMCGFAVFAKRSLFYELLAVLFMLLASLCKESFIVFIPAFIAIYIWLIHEHKQVSFKTIIYRKLPFISILLLIMMLEIFGVYKLIGIRSGPADAYNGLKIANTLASLSAILFDTNRNMRLDGNNYGFLILILVVVYWYVYKNSKTDNNNNFKTFVYKLLSVFVITLLVLLPQLLLYMNFGMHERYLIPSTFGVSLLVIYLADGILKTERNKVTHLLLFSFLCFILIKSTAFCYKSYKEFAKEGISFNKFLTLIKQDSKPSDPILLVSDLSINAELSYFSIHYFESSLNDRNNFYVFYLNENKINDYNESDPAMGQVNLELYKKKSYENHASLDYKVIAMPVEKELLLILYNGINLKNYIRQPVDNEWVIYYKPTS